MKGVEDYLERAEHAVTMMERETDPRARKAFERAARAWLSMAESRMEDLMKEAAAGDGNVIRLTPKDEA